MARSLGRRRIKPRKLLARTVNAKKRIATPDNTIPSVASFDRVTHLGTLKEFGG